MPVLNIYYKENTGEIHSFQGGDTLTPVNEIPKGCKRVAFGGNISIWDQKTHRTIYKVDVNTKQLVLITDTPPIEEKEVLVDLERKLIIMRDDLKTAKEENDFSFAEYLHDEIEKLQLKIDRLKAEAGDVQTHIA